LDQRHSESRTPPLRVLVVEDNPDGREILRQLLELLGYRVEVAADGVEGVEKALGWRPDVAVVDIGLPRMDGYEVARNIRQALGCEIFLITQTGYGQPEDRRRALASGFDVHLVKPVDPADLCGWINTARCRLPQGRNGGEDGTPGSATSPNRLAALNGSEHPVRNGSGR
jgi:CheY-like chemotaxis protein